MTRKEIMKAKRDEQDYRRGMQNDHSIHNLIRAFNRGEIDLSEPQYPELEFEISLEVEINTNNLDVERERSKEYRNEKRKFIAQLEVEYSTKPLFCPLCGQVILNGNPISTDHKLPRSHGGSDVADNFQPTHPECNERRGCNKQRKVKFFDTKLKAHVERTIYQDTDRTTWNVTIRNFVKKSLINVLVITKTNDGHRRVNNLFYDIGGNRLNRKSKSKYYNHSRANYRKSRGGGR